MKWLIDGSLFYQLIWSRCMSNLWCRLASKYMKNFFGESILSRKTCWPHHFLWVRVDAFLSFLNLDHSFNGQNTLCTMMMTCYSLEVKIRLILKYWLHICLCYVTLHYFDAIKWLLVTTMFGRSSVRNLNSHLCNDKRYLQVHMNTKCL